MSEKKRDNISIARDIISWLEDTIASEYPTSCNISIINAETEEKYEIPKGAYLKDYPDTLRYVLNTIIRYKRTFGIKETKKQLENAPNLSSELIIAGKGKVLEYILRNDAA